MTSKNIWRRPKNTILTPSQNLKYFSLLQNNKIVSLQRRENRKKIKLIAMSMNATRYPNDFVNHV